MKWESGYFKISGLFIAAWFGVSKNKNVGKGWWADVPSDLKPLEQRSRKGDSNSMLVYVKNSSDSYQQFKLINIYPVSYR